MGCSSWMISCWHPEDRISPSIVVSCLVSSSNLSKSSSNSESVLGLIASNSGSVVANWKFDFFELINEVVDLLASCGLWSVLIDRATIETAWSVCDEDPGAHIEGGAFGERRVVVERSHWILLTIVGECPYLAHQMSVFYRQALRGIPRGDWL